MCKRKKRGVQQRGLGGNGGGTQGEQTWEDSYASSTSQQCSGFSRRARELQFPIWGKNLCPFECAILTASHTTASNTTHIGCPYQLLYYSRERVSGCFLLPYSQSLFSCCLLMGVVSNKQWAVLWVIVTLISSTKQVRCCGNVCPKEIIPFHEDNFPQVQGCTNFEKFFRMP